MIKIFIEWKSYSTPQNPQEEEENDKQCKAYVPSIVLPMCQRLSKQVKNEHDSLENDAGSSASKFSQRCHDTKEDWDKPEMVSLKLYLQFTFIPAKKKKKKKKKPFSKRFLNIIQQEMGLFEDKEVSRNYLELAHEYPFNILWERIDLETIYLQHQKCIQKYTQDSMTIP